MLSTSLELLKGQEVANFHLAKKKQEKEKKTQLTKAPNSP